MRRTNRERLFQVRNVLPGIRQIRSRTEHRCDASGRQVQIVRVAFSVFSTRWAQCYGPRATWPSDGCFAPSSSVGEWLQRLGAWLALLAIVALALYLAQRYYRRRVIYRDLRMARIAP